MSMNYVKLSQVIKDFIVTLDGDDYVSNASDTAIRNFALRGIREIGFDLGKRIKSLKLAIDTTNDTVALPDDFVDFSKIGIVDEDLIIRPLVQNNNINYSSKRLLVQRRQRSRSARYRGQHCKERNFDKTATGSTPKNLMTALSLTTTRSKAVRVGCTIRWCSGC